MSPAPQRPRNQRSRLLSVGEAAAYLGVSAASLRKWSDAGLIPVLRTPGGQRRFALADLDRFMQDLKRAGRPPRGLRPRSTGRP